MAREADVFFEVRNLVRKARLLRRLVRHSPSQKRRDEAIIEYTRTLDRLLDRMTVLHDEGHLGDAPAPLPDAND